MRDLSPPDRRHWVFFEECGCPIGVLDQTPTTPRSKAWREMFDTARERNAAIDRGVTVVEMDHGRYSAEVHPVMLSSAVCPHRGDVVR